MRTLQLALAALIGAVVLAGTLGFGGVLLVNHGPAVAEGWRSRDWPGKPAVITRSEAVQKVAASGWSRSGIGTHAVQVAYAYSVEGRVFNGTRISLDHEGKIHSDVVAQKHADTWARGKRVTAYYDPADPATALLEPGVPTGGVLGVFFGVVLIATGILPFWLGYRIWVYRAKRRGGVPQA